MKIKNRICKNELRKKAHLKKFCFLSIVNRVGPCRNLPRKMMKPFDPRQKSIICF